VPALAAALALAPGSALASSHAKAPVGPVAEPCLEPMGGIPTGTASFRRKGNMVKAAFHLKGGIPGAAYTASLWVRFEGICGVIGQFAHFATNRHGNGAGKGELPVPIESDQSFFALANTEEGLTFVASAPVTLTP
jgi:hypothetical protein